MAYTTVVTKAVGDVGLAADWNTYVRDNFDATVNWTSYTPTLFQPASIAKTVTYAKYRKFGTTCICVVSLVATGTGTTGNIVAVSMPVGATAAGPTNLLLGGAGSWASFGGGNLENPVVSAISTSTTFKFLSMTAGTTGSYAGLNPRAAFGGNDVIRFTAEYETT